MREFNGTEPKLHQDEGGKFVKVTLQLSSDAEATDSEEMARQS
jgi:hypothetical protein